MTQRIAPGIALVRPEDCAPLARALARQGSACAVERGDTQDHRMQTSANTHESEPSVCARPRSSASDTQVEESPRSVDLSPGEHAALLVACAHYRQHASSTAPLLPNTALEPRAADVQPVGD